MTFLAGAFLAALPLVAVPVIIHLLNRRRRKVVRWGAMRFLAEAATRRHRAWRVDDLLLMLLRVIVVAAIVMALAQPLVHSGLFSPAGVRDVILVLDVSMSTARSVGGQTLLEREIEQADKIIGRLGEGDMVRVLLASSSPQWLTPVPIAAGSQARGELLSRLRQLKPTLSSLDLLRSAEEAIQAESANHSDARLITIITDGQACGWRVESTDGWRRLDEARRKTAVATELNVVNVGESAPVGANLSVESLVATRSIAAPGQPVGLTATVRNRGSEPAGGTLVAWSEGKNSLGASSLKKLAPGESAQVSIEYKAGLPGSYELQCRIEQADVLEMDNTGRFVLQVVDQAPILLVGSAAQVDLASTDTGYLLVALGYDWNAKAQPWRSVFRPTCVTNDELARTPLGGFSCVILSNVGEVSAEARAALLDYVRQGGGLWIAAGDATTPAAFNRAFFNGEAALSPLALGEAVGQVADYEHGVAIHPPATVHPATVLLGDTKRLDLDRARVFRRFSFVLRPTDKDVSVLLTVGNGEPLAVEKQVGRGRVIVQGLPLGVRWSNLPACQVFVPLIHEWLWYLSEPSAPRRNVALGESLAVSLPASDSPTAKVTDPSGQVSTLPLLSRSDRNEFLYDRAFVPGRYVVTLASAGKPERAVPFNVAREAEESDLAALTNKQMETLTAVGGLKFIADPLSQKSVGQAVEQLRPIWWWLLVGLLGVMLLELVLAWWLTVRHKGQVAGVAMTNDVHLSAFK